VRSRVLCTLLILLTFGSYSQSQVATGILRFNSYGGGPFDTVNLGNLNVHFSVPVLHKAGRGVPFAYDLNYDSSIYRPVVSNGTSSWQPVTNIGNIASYWGWQGLGPVFSPYAGYQVTYFTNSCGQFGQNTYQEWQFTNFVYYDASGTGHPAGGTGGTYIDSGACGGFGPPNGPNPAGVNTGKMTDGSGYIVNFSVNAGFLSGNIQSKDGTTISAGWFSTPPTGSSPYTATDKNGNKISLISNGSYTDTLGQTVLIATGAAPNPVSFSYIPPANEGSGTRVSVTGNFVNYTVKTNFGALDSGGHAIAEYSSSTAVALVDNITLPDGTQYKFNYEATPATPSSGACTPIPGTTCTTGRILKITLPTGGTITYGYTGGANGIFNDGSTAGLTRQLSSPGGTSSYSRSQVSGNYWTTTVTSPTGDNTVLNFTEDSATTAPTYSFYETQRQTNQLISGVQTPLLTTVTCWNAATNCTTTAITSPITQMATTLQYPNGGLQTKTVTFFNGISPGSGLVSETDNYAYSSGVPSTLIRKTLIGYTTLGNNITDRPGRIITYDGNNKVLSQTGYAFDEYSTYPLQPTTGTPQQGSISGARGNVTTIVSTVTGTTALTRHFAYYDTGNVYKSYDVNGQITTYNYSTAAQGNSTKSCGNSFPTSVTLPISGLSSSASTTYDCIGGVVTAATDLNGNSGSTSYTDAFFWRPASATAPYTPTATTTTNFTYTPYNSSNGNLAKVENKMLFNSSNSVVDQLTTLGTFGQGLYSQQREGPSSTSYDSTQVLYDSFVRVYKSAMPCVSTSSTFTDQNQACPTAATTASTFDAMGRVTQTTDGGAGYATYTYNQNDVKQAVGPAPAGENLKQKQLEYDALGRLTSVCEITQLASPNTCGQTGGNYTGYLTTYAYGVNASNYPTTTVTQGPSGSQQTRVYTYDLLGRLISEQNPENGTTSYTYDSDSSGTCSGTYTGDLVKLVDAKGNKICYQYDAIHRNTSITYPSSGPDASVTQSKTFVYDSATFNGTTMASPKGRLVEAYTGLSGSKTTDEFFSYSVRGELLDTWQCTPHSGTNGCAAVGNYYHVTAGFWENGALKSLASSISGLPTQTYNVDAMGRPNTVSASSGQNPVTSTSFDLPNFKTTVTYGSADSDVVTLDPNTGRMTQYKFNVGSQNDTGNFTWNANGSLGTLAITNQLNSLDTQTCSYTHDDLSRISSVGCLNGTTHRWDQNFTYDAFGNITKAVPNGGTGLSFQPTYDTSKNWITALPGIPTTTTDGNGQMTYDGSHNYTWDAEGKMHTLDTTTMTYDALGRMAEKAVGSTYTQIIYGPRGRFATMNGQTLVSAFIPAPGAQVVYTSASLNTTNKIAYYRHADHLGSSRLATTPSRTLYSSTAYAPFGEAYSQSGTTDLSFTGQEQDTVSGIYDFPARKYPANQGRWLSPDPAGLSAVNPSSPQSWNRYTYVLNNPLSMVDPLGLCDDGDTCSDWGSDDGGGGWGGGGWGGDGGGDGGWGGYYGFSGDGNPGGSYSGGISPPPPGWPSGYDWYVGCAVQKIVVSAAFGCFGQSGNSDLVRFFEDMGAFGGSGGGGGGGGAANNQLNQLLDKLSKCPDKIASRMVSDLRQLQAAGKLTISDQSSTSFNGAVSIDSTDITAHALGHEWWHTVERNQILSGAQSGASSSGQGSLLGAVYGQAMWFVARNVLNPLSALQPDALGNRGLGALDQEAEVVGQGISHRCGID
jgi:RHS repeat-associated protein